jgi:hypothetical protein
MNGLINLVCIRVKNISKTLQDLLRLIDLGLILVKEINEQVTSYGFLDD